MAGWAAHAAHRHGLRRPCFCRRRPDHAGRHCYSACPRARRAQRRRRRAARHYRCLARRRRPRRYRRAFPTFRSALERRAFVPISGTSRRAAALKECRDRPFGLHRDRRRAEDWSAPGRHSSTYCRNCRPERRPGQHQGDDDRRPRLHRPPRGNGRPSGCQHPREFFGVRDSLLPDKLVDKAREVVEANIKAGRRVTVAESCPGGLVSAAITEIPGSSEMFEAGYVTYSNAAKIHELKVSSEVVETFGAVSVATAWAMARGALAASDADIAVAITGVAGPGGGST